jgi:hypothetical protein
MAHVARSTPPTLREVVADGLSGLITRGELA